jgi:xanthine/CO dehydrogenase XdhC/CoxF family maturation factor
VLTAPKDALVSLSLHKLLPLFEGERARGSAMVLATVARTAGSTYTKAGAHMLIAGDGEYAGLLSGGCLEGDLAELARGVLSSGSATVVRYDMRGPDDLLFGLGSGCEGAMDVVLQRLDASNDWQPLRRLAEAWRAQRPESLLLVVNSAQTSLPVGAGIFAGDAQPFGLDATFAAEPSTLASMQRIAADHKHLATNRLLPAALPGVDFLSLHQPRPTRVLLLGAGPDAQPVALLASLLGWHITVIDHRTHFAQTARFPAAGSVLDGGAKALTTLLSSHARAGAHPVESRSSANRPHAPAFAAAIVMSHHLTTDLAYLRALTGSDIPYVGLLGPATRRQRLIDQLGDSAQWLHGRLRAPVGLDLGANSPETIALSIVAEIQAALAGHASQTPLSQVERNLAVRGIRRQ